MKLIPLAGRVVSRIANRRSQTVRLNLHSLLSLLSSFVVMGVLGAANALGATAERLPIASASASADDGNVAANAIDGSLATRWSASGDGQWIRFDLGATKQVGSINLAWYKGDQRRSRFDVQVSLNGTSWTTVFTGQSSGTTAGLETFDVTDASGRYVQVVGHGNSSDLWNSLSEAEIYGPGSGAGTESTELHLRIAWASQTATGPTISVVNGAPGTTYLLQVSTNLVNWVDTGHSFTNPGALPWQDDVSRLSGSARVSRMYRIKAVASAPPTNNLPTIAKSLSGLAMGGKKLVLWRNRPPDVSDPRVTRAYIVIHGAGANAEGYFDRLNEVVPSDWVQSTIVLAPYFQLEADASSGEWWWADDWREGGASGGLSSYTAMDNLIATLRSGYFPNLKWVVVCGHSAGGQFTQRYAAFTDIDLRSAPNSPFIKFVPANPSSYVYLNEYRPGPNNTWIIPQECSSGDHYNEWKYGLDGLYGYTAARGVNWPRTHLPTCQVELLAGTADVNEDHGFDASCAAMRQGPTRYERAHNFNAYMDQFYPSNRFSITDVPGVGHDSTLMFASPQGRAALFFAD